MRHLLWAVAFATIVAIAVLCWRRYRNWQAKQHAEQERFAAFMAETMNSTMEAQKRKLPKP